MNIDIVTKFGMEAIFQEVGGEKSKSFEGEWKLS